MSNTLPVTVVGGYLGAGKTTLVNHLLRHADGRRLAILVNEFGALPIDEDLIEATSDDLISIAGGCICCSFGSDLAAALTDMSNRNPRPDHIVIETSGVAMPGAVAASIGLLDKLSLAGVFVLADAETVLAQLTDEYIGDTIERQLKEADAVVITKADLIDSAQHTETQLRSINPEAAILKADFGKLPVEILLGQHNQQTSLLSSNHADEAYVSHVYKPPADCMPGNDKLASIARAITATPYNVVRSKGFFCDEDGQMWLLQTVGRRFEITRFDKPVEPQLVLIGLRDHIQISSVLSALEELLAVSTVKDKGANKYATK